MKCSQNVVEATRGKPTGDQETFKKKLLYLKKVFSERYLSTFH